MGDLLTGDVLENLGIDDLLDAKISEIEEAAGFLVPVKGMYLLDVVCDVKMVGKKGEEVKAIVVDYTINETIELTNADDTPEKKGGQFSINYRGGKGVQYFRTDFGSVSESFGPETTLKDLIEKLNGVTINAVITHQKNKEDKDIIYTRVGKIKLA